MARTRYLFDLPALRGGRSLLAGSAAGADVLKGEGNKQERKCDMDYAEWEKHKDELHNESMKPFCRFSDEAREVMQSAEKEGASIDVLDCAGLFRRKQCKGFQGGYAYRVSPYWPGPAKPEPKPEYVDESIHTSGGMYVLYHHSGCVLWLCDAQNNVAFSGYVYETDGKERVRPRLLFDAQPDGTFRLRVPKAVRFVKEAV
jgi:hypothetical protein